MPFAVLTQRLRTIGLRPLDISGDGDCFFKAVSHQLCGTPDCHFAIRDAGIQYLRDHPEEFIESNVANSWLGYLNTMSMQGTWCDGLIVQAVANALGITLHIISLRSADAFPVVASRKCVCASQATYHRISSKSYREDNN